MVNKDLDGLKLLLAKRNGAQSVTEQIQTGAECINDETREEG